MIDPSKAPEPARPGTSPIGEPEHYGPLEVWRYLKADGRELILYALRDDDD